MPPPTAAHRTLTDSEQEGESGVIELKAARSDGETSGEDGEVYDEPEIVKLMVEYFYHFDYLCDTDSISHPTASPPPAAKTARQSFAKKKVKRKDVRIRLPPPADQTQQPPSQTYIIEHAKVFAIAVKYQIDGLRDLAASKFKDAATAHLGHEDFVHSIYVAYNSTPDEVTQLRDVVTDILHQHFDDLEDDPEVEAALCYVQRLAYDVLKRSRAGDKNESTTLADGSYKCDECGYRFAGTPGGTSKSGRPVRETMWCPQCW
jgi:hypothetical protein